MEITRPTVMEVSKENFNYNVQQIQNYVGENVELMPVIKANGYGTYVNTQLDLINQFNIVAVATVDEGVKIRELGYDKEIFVLNQAFETEIEKILKYNLVVGISSYGFAEKLAETQKDVTVHVEIGTGMGRTGVHPYRLEKFLRSLSSNIKVEGIYTHMSSADIDDEYTKKQIESFNYAIDVAKSIVGELKYIHAGASNGLLNYPEAHYNLVRPGIILYGYAASDTTFDKIDLKPIATLKSKITFLKEVESGTSIGYSRSYITDKNMKVATIPIGYADGFRRTFSNGWEVLINGKRAKIIGKVCMDSFMADVTDIPDVKVGDDVYIWDNKEIKLEDLSDKCDTINYEIISQVGERVPRRFV